MCGAASCLQLQDAAGLRGWGVSWAGPMGLPEVLQYLEQLSHWVLGGWRQMQDEGRAGRVAPVWKAGGPLGGRPHPPSPKGGSGGKHLPPPGPVSTGPASGPALSCRCFSLWERTGCEGFWCPRPEGWVTQGGPPELEGAPGGRGLLQCTGKSVDPGLGPWSPPASAVQPPPLVPPHPPPRQRWINGRHFGNQA